MSNDTPSPIELIETYFTRQQADALCFADYQTAAATERITITDPAHLTFTETSTLRAQVTQYGFAVVQMDESHINKASLKTFAEQLDLGAPFVPPYFQQFNSQIELDHGINTIGATCDPHEMSFPKIQHGAFGTKQAQELHVDGTVQAIGQIQTSMIACQTRAMNGGLSTFFNATAAFRELTQDNPEAAAAMLAPQALSRAVDTAPHEPHTGAVFALLDDSLHTRFSRDGRSYWEEGFAAIPHLKAAYDYFSARIYSGSPYYIETLLEPGQALLVANSKISHGRTAYESYPDAERRMFRALFEKAPA